MKKGLLLLISIILLTGCTKKYTVTFMDNNMLLASVEIKKGDNLNDVNKPEKDGYIFVSWMLNGREYDTDNPINEDITLEASWVTVPDIVNKYTVTFNYGTVTKTQTVNEGELAIEPEAVPKLNKHKFVGWYLDDTLYDFKTPVTKDINLMAKFEKNRVVIKYDLGGAPGVTQTEINMGSIPKKPNDPERFGYDFIGWTIGDKPYNFDTPIDTDVTIKANYKATIYYMVSYDTDSDSVFKNEYVAEGKTISELPVPSKDGYKFKYWTFKGEKVTTETKVLEDMELLAIYEEITIENEVNE